MLRLLLAAALVAATLSGCATAPSASPAQDQAAKTFATKPGMANIYVYRHELFGAAINIDVFLNGKFMGKTGAQTYFLFEVPPGRHTLLSKAENDSTLEVNAQAGRNYFVWQEVKYGVLYGRSLLQLMDEATGKAGVGECKLLTASP